MKRFLLAALLIFTLSGYADAAIMVMSTNGTYTTKTTLEVARTALDAAGKTVVVTTALTEAQSNITAAWPADRALKVEKGGSIANSTAFTVTGPLTMSGGAFNGSGAVTINGPFSAGLYQVFAGSGAVVFGVGSVPAINPEWYAGTDTQKVQAAVNSASLSGWVPVEVNRKYTLTSSVMIDRAVDTTTNEFVIFGSGVDAGFYTSSAITMFSTTLPTLGVTVPGKDSPCVEFIHFKNIRFEASASSTTLNAYCVDASKYLRMKFTYCYFRYIRCGVSNTYLQSWYFDHCNIRRVGGYFLDVDSGPNALVMGLVSDLHWTDTMWEEGQIGGTISSFLRTNGPITGASFKGGVFENASGPVYAANQSWGVSISGVYLEALTNYAFILSGEASSYRGTVAIHGNFFNGIGSEVGNYAISTGQVSNISSGGNYSDANIYHATSMLDGGDGLSTTGDFALGEISDLLHSNNIQLSLSLTGFASPLAITGKVIKSGNIVTLSWPRTEGTSNATSMTITGIPSALLPKISSVSVQTVVLNNGVHVNGVAIIDSSVISFYPDPVNNTLFSATGSKGLPPNTVSWQLPSTVF